MSSRENIRQVAVASDQENGETLYILDSDGVLWERAFVANPVYRTKAGNALSWQDAKTLDAAGHQRTLVGWRQVDMSLLDEVVKAAALIPIPELESKER